MEDDNYYGSYEESEHKNPLVKMILIILAIIVVFVIIVLVTRSCNRSTVESNLLAAGKSYYESNDNALPNSVGECNTVTLSYLKSEKLIKTDESYNSCDDTGTYVKVCKLESGTYHYTPVIQCGTKDDTVFGDYKEGKESDLVTDKSDVRFIYMGQVYSSQSKLYYPNNKTNIDEVTELYTSAPSNDYSHKGEAVKNAYKWYTESTGTSYWNNGAYSPTAPSGYPSQGKEGTATTKISLTAPASASYRTINQTQVYRTRNVSTPVAYKYTCISRTLAGELISTTPCGRRTDSYTEYKKIHYTCDGTTDVEKANGCPTSDWSAWTTTACSTEGIVQCESKTGYVYTDKTWQWYVSGSYKSYYPSGSADASGENTYYVDSPKTGYVKDNGTQATAYRFYKLSDIEDKDSKDGEWIKISDDYLDIDELLSSFKENGFEVKSLKEIEKNEKIKYSVKIEYANRQ